MRRAKNALPLSDAGLFTIMGTGFFAIGTILSTVFCWGLPVDLMLAQEHAEVAGMTDDVAINRHVMVNHEHPFLIRYHYAVDGQTYDGSVNTFDEDLVNQAKMTHQVAVEFAPSRPSWNRLKGTTYASFGYWGLFTLLFPAIGLAFFAGALRSGIKQRQLASG